MQQEQAQKLLDEEPLLLAEAAKVCPSPVHAATISRWCLRGLDGVYLEHIRVGRKLLTTREALARFLAKVTERGRERGQATAERIRQRRVREGSGPSSGRLPQVEQDAEAARAGSRAGQARARRPRHGRREPSRRGEVIAMPAPLNGSAILPSPTLGEALIEGAVAAWRDDGDTAPLLRLAGHSQGLRPNDAKLLRECRRAIEGQVRSDPCDVVEAFRATEKALLADDLDDRLLAAQSVSAARFDERFDG